MPHAPNPKNMAAVPYMLRQIKFLKILTYLYRYSIVKLVYNDHPWDPKIVAAVDRSAIIFIKHASLKTLSGDNRIQSFGHKI
jgi:hypothetical protein